MDKAAKVVGKHGVSNELPFDHDVQKGSGQLVDWMGKTRPQAMVPMLYSHIEHNIWHGKLQRSTVSLSPIFTLSVS